LDEGRLTDTNGNVVDFSHTVVVVTSNVGGGEVVQSWWEDKEKEAVGGGGGGVGGGGVGGSGNGGDEHKAMSAAVLSRVRAHFPPELLNRFDEVVVCRALGEEAMIPLLDREVKRVERILLHQQRRQKRQRQRQQPANIHTAGGGQGGTDLQMLRVEVTDAARVYLVQRACEAPEGARRLRRLVDRELVWPLAQLVLRLQEEDPHRQWQEGRHEKSIIVVERDSTGAHDGQHGLQLTLQSCSSE
jgi:ATP-dependent Clp protease ATP-binding subunit ClpC